MEQVKKDTHVRWNVRKGTVANQERKGTVANQERKEGRKEMFYLTTHSTHFIYGYMASDIW